MELTTDRLDTQSPTVFGNKIAGFRWSSAIFTAHDTSINSRFYKNIISIEIKYFINGEKNITVAFLKYLFRRELLSHAYITSVRSFFGSEREGDSSDWLKARCIQVSIAIKLKIRACLVDTYFCTHALGRAAHPIAFVSKMNNCLCFCVLGSFY